MIYLDNAATTFPKPAQVYRAASGVMERLGANPGRSGHRMSLAAGRVVMRCRDALAALLNVDAPERIVFCLNCTDALNMAIRGLPLSGGHVIAMALDHNASLRPLCGMAARGEIELDVLTPGPDGAVSRAQVERALRPDTRLVAMSHASNVTGALQPAAEIGALCREKGALFLLDAAQTLGVEPVHPEALCADLLAFPGHKGLLGPMGTGGLWLREGLTLSPYREGGTGSRSESPLQPDDLPDRYESGTLNLPGLAGLLAGARFVAAHGGEIREKEAALARRLRAGLAAMPSVTLYGPEAPSVGIVSFNLAGRRSGDVADRLNRLGIGVRAGLHCAPLAHRALGTLETGVVRASPGFFNTEGDIDRLLSAVWRISLEPEF